MPTSRKPPPVAEPEEQEIPDIPSKERSRSVKKLQASVEGFYIMLGGALSVLPPQIVSPRARYIGLSLTQHASPIADAWIDLAEEDARVKRMIESLAGFNAWGKVVGEHLSAIGEATPAIANRNQQAAPTDNPDLAAMMGFAQMFAEQAAAERAPANGPPPQPGPSPEVQQRMRQQEQQREQRPRRQTQQQPVAQEPPPVVSQRRPVGMPSPADLGVTVTDQPEDFPTSGADNVRG